MSSDERISEHVLLVVDHFDIVLSPIQCETLLCEMYLMTPNKPQLVSMAWIKHYVNGGWLSPKLRGVFWRRRLSFEHHGGLNAHRGFPNKQVGQSY
jgi:hypothetical protein